MKAPIATFLLCLITIVPARAAEPVDPKLLDVFSARPLGPGNMGGRVTAVAVVADRPATMYVAAASGGLWKTTNAGTTWTPVFDQQATASMGDVAVAPSNSDIIWVGTGEANARNSVSWGDGVYKSTDAGKTWKNMGLRETHHIGRVVIHPTDPDIVYVAALGHIWGPNPQRGIYKTQDGGHTWEKVKFIDEDTGFIDLVMDPDDPDVLCAAAYRVRRGPFAGGNPATLFGKESGLYKTTDGGRTWTKLKNGLPDLAIGRCGLSIYRKDPRILYAVIQTEKTDIRTVPGQASRSGDNAETGGVFRSDDGGDSWVKLNDLCPRPFYFGQIRVDPNDDRRVYVLGVSLHLSTDGGKTFGDNAAPSVHADQHALWINPKYSEHMVVGCDGGVYFSHDRGQSWEHCKNLPIAQFYGVAVDIRKPYRVYGGLQDNGTWGGASATHNPEGITAADWIRVLGADGFQCQVDPTDSDIVYAESQYGGLTRVNVRTGESTSIRPRAPKGDRDYRFNWCAPILLSPHNPHTLYYGGNHVFRSIDRGDTWTAISPDLTLGKPGPSSDNGHTLTALAESPLRAGLLYAGSDDGRLHVTRNGGNTWIDVGLNVSEMPAERWISRIECSHFDEGTAYLAVDRHRNDDRAPYLFKTTDCGTTWVAISNDLPSEGSVYVVREDPRNQQLLFTGTEFGLFVSLNGGANWQRLKKGLPTVPVHDLVIHPRERDLVIATHGRGLYVMDIAPLQAWMPRILEEPAQLFDVKPGIVFRYHGAHGLGGGKTFAAPNPSYGTAIYYYLREKPSGPAKITVVDALGNAIAMLDTVQEPGLHRVSWNLRPNITADPMRGVPIVSAGDYAVRLEVGGKVLVKKLRIETEE